MKLRTFVALELPTAPRAELLGHLQRWKAQSPYHAKWVKPENLHITLLFIGDLDSGRIKELSSILRGLCTQFDPPLLAFA